MAADVSSLFRVLSGYRDDRKVSNEPADGKSTASLITRDLLGAGDASLKDESQELDLDLQVPSGWEKRLDLKSGKVYLQRCNSSNSSLSYSDHRQQPNQTVAELQDLNFPPSPSKITLNLFEEGNLELKLVPSSPSSSPAAATSSSSNYQSVCTLDKVKCNGWYDGGHCATVEAIKDAFKLVYDSEYLICFLIEVVMVEIMIETEKITLVTREE
eukprot:XP_015571127.1 uncharacterized protein LOC8272598 [Ricinus communis]